MPGPVDWEALWSAESRRKQLPSLHDIVSKYGGRADIIPMHGGLPPANSFPFTSLGAGVAPPSGAGASSSLDVADPALVAAAQQYNMQPRGYGPLIAWAAEITADLHRPAALQPQPPLQQQQQPGGSGLGAPGQPPLGEALLSDRELLAGFPELGSPRSGEPAGPPEKRQRLLVAGDTCASFNRRQQQQPPPQQ